MRDNVIVCITIKSNPLIDATVRGFFTFGDTCIVQADYRLSSSPFNHL